MNDIILYCDAGTMSDPDLDIRYELPDFLESKLSGVKSDGYDYSEDTTILELYLTTEAEIAVQVVRDVARRHERWGVDVGVAIRIIVKPSFEAEQ